MISVIQFIVLFAHPVLSFIVDPTFMRHNIITV